MVDAVEKAGVPNTVWYNYRRVPAVTLAKQIVDSGKLDITQCAGYWLKDASDRGIKHICWDGCMFPNATLETPATWNTILRAMMDVRDAHGWE